MSNIRVAGLIVLLTTITTCRSKSLEPPMVARPQSDNTKPAPSNRDIKRQGAIREVDFKSFTYPWYPSYLKPPDGKNQLKMVEGKFEIERNKELGIDNLAVELQDVSFAQLLGDGSEQAIVTIGGVSVFNRFVDCIFIYGLENKRPLLLWKHETGDRAAGGLRRISVQNGVLLIEQYSNKAGDKGLCCPVTFTRTTYKWGVDRFQETKSETLPNEFATAKFIGFPDDSP